MRRSFLPEGFQRLIRRHPVLILLVLSSSIFFTPRISDSHEPITTKVTFNREIVRIFQRHCLSCHAGQSAGNVTLSSFATARPWAKAFKEEVLEKRMPPFQAVKGFGQFHNDYTLTQLEIDQIVSWVEGGVPKGDDKDIPPSFNANNWVLGSPDLTFEATDGARSSETSQCFSFPTKLTKSQWLSGFDFHPGTSVHCASFAIVRAGGRQMLDHSVDCDKVEISAANTFGNWVPGQNVYRLNDSGRLITAGANIVVRIHYAADGPSNKPSSLGLYFGKRPTRSLQTIPISAAAQDVPAGQQDFRIESAYTVKEDTEAIAVRPLLFPYAKSIDVTGYRPDGSVEVLVWAKDYRYDWQPEYEFKKPVPIPKGTRIQVIAYLDNSDKNPNNPHNPAQTIRFTAPLVELSFIDNSRVKRHGRRL